MIKDASDPLLTSSITSTSPASELSMSTSHPAPPIYTEVSDSRATNTNDANTRAIPSGQMHLYSRPAQVEALHWSGSEDVVDIDVFKSRDGSMISHDPALEDPDILSEWVRYQASKPPKFMLRCRGSHKRANHRTEAEHPSGHRKPRSQGESEGRTVIDFDFFIDLRELLQEAGSGNPQQGVILSTVPPSMPAIRGSQYLSLHPTLAPPQAIYHDHDRDPTLNWSADTSPGLMLDQRDSKSWLKRASGAWASGMPIWAINTHRFEEFWHIRKGKADHDDGRRPRDNLTDASSGRAPHGYSSLDGSDQLGTHEVESGSVESTAADTSNNEPEDAHPRAPPSPIAPTQATVKDWIRAYCFSQEPLKEFVLTKEVWGWDTEAMVKAIQALITSTGYQGEVSVEFPLEEWKFIVKPDSWISRLTSQDQFISFLSYPAVVMCNYFNNGGAKYETVRASYALKCYISTEPATDPSDDREAEGPALPPFTAIASNDTRQYHLYGQKEGTFLRKWEAAIKFAVGGRYKGDLAKADVSGSQVQVTLDGYED